MPKFLVWVYVHQVCAGFHHGSKKWQWVLLELEFHIAWVGLKLNHAVEDALELLILLSLCPKYWDCMRARLSRIYLVLGIKARALSMLFKLSTHSATCPALYNLFWMTQISSDLANGSTFMLAHRWIFFILPLFPFFQWVESHHAGSKHSDSSNPPASVSHVSGTTDIPLYASQKSLGCVLHLLRESTCLSNARRYFGPLITYSQLQPLNPSFLQVAFVLGGCICGW